MLLNTHSYRKAEVAEEPHNLLVDFHPEPLFHGPDRSFSNIQCGLPYPLGEPMELPDQLFKMPKPKNSMPSKAQSKKLLDSVTTTTVGKSVYKYMPQNLLRLYYNHSLEEQYTDMQTKNLLSIIKLGKNEYLIWPVFNGQIKLMNIRNSKDTFNLSKKFDSKITLIKCYQIDEAPYVLMRCCYSSVKLFRIAILPDLTEVYERHSDDVVVDVALNPKNIEHLALVTINSLIVQNILSNQHIFKLKNSNIVQCEFLEDNYVLVLQKFTVQLFDYLSGALLRTFDPQLIPCNQMCSFKVLNKTLLLVSQHYVIRTDLDMFESFTTYSHTLSETPMLVDAVSCNDEQYLCLATLEDSKKVIFAGSVAFGLPIKPPGLKTTLQEAILKEPALGLKENLDKRLSFATVGLKTLEQDENVFIYTINAVGDIFRQELSLRTINCMNSIEKVCEWAEKLSSTIPALHVTHFAQLDSAFLFLKTATATKRPAEAPKEKLEEQTINFLEKFKPIYSKSNITSTFGRGLLEIWENSDESDEDGYPGEEETEVPFYDKVSEWFGKTNDGEETIGLDPDFMEM